MEHTMNTTGIVELDNLQKTCGCNATKWKGSNVSFDLRVQESETFCANVLLLSKNIKIHKSVSVN